MEVRNPFGQRRKNIKATPVPKNASTTDSTQRTVFSRPIVPKEYIKTPIAVRLPFKEWLEKNRIPESARPVVIFSHAHTDNSYDAYNPPEEFEEVLKQGGYNGLIVTDHDHNGFVTAQDGSKSIPYLINGTEMMCSYNGRHADLIGAFLERGLQTESMDSFSKIADDIHRKGGIVIIPHPNNNSVNGVHLEELTENELAKVDFVETHNARHYLGLEKCEQRRKQVIGFLKKYNETHNHKIRNIVGTDAHDSSELAKSAHLVAFEPHVNTLGKMKQALLDGEYHLLVHRLYKRPGF